MSLIPRLPRMMIFAPPVAAITAACGPAPRLQNIPQVAAAAWLQPSPTSNAPLPANLGQAFASPTLEALIARALLANADLGMSAARVDQARAQLRLARADMLPVVLASAHVLTSRVTNGAAKPFESNEGSAGVDVAFDVDLFGRARAGRLAAQARYAAASFDRQALALVVEGEVARAFVQHATLSERLALLDRNIAQARELLRVIEVRQRLGEANRVDTGLQTIQLRQLEVQRHRLAEARSRTANALAVLVGEEAPGFAVPAVKLHALAVPSISPVQPAELLVRRPDMRAAEARVAAARGDVAEARAAFLPSLRLSAGGIAQAMTLGAPIGTVVTAGANLLAPIFDLGRLRGQVAMANGRQVESIESYRKSLLTSVAETQDALEAVERSRAREALLDDVVAQAVTTARLARSQYVGGDADLQWVLDAEQRLVEAQDARAVALQERLEAAIELYRAMGGGAAQPTPHSVG